MMKIKQISIDELNISTIEACKYYILDFADESMNDIYMLQTCEILEIIKGGNYVLVEKVEEGSKR